MADSKKSQQTPKPKPLPKTRSVKKRSNGKRSTAMETQARVQKVYDLILRGASRSYILQVASELGWGVCDRSVDRYIQDARALFAEQAAAHRDEALGLALARAEELYGKTFTIQDYARALAVEKHRALLLGLYAPTRQEITGADGGMITIRAIDYRVALQPLAPDDEAHDVS